MKLKVTFGLLLSCFTAFSQGSVDWTKAPNSYIFTGQDKNGGNVSGLYIPVKKAYAMWADNSNAELSLNSPIPAGIVSAYVYWEDVSGLIATDLPDYKLNIHGGTSDPQDAKIRVLIDKTKGKGNAVITLHSGPNGDKTDPVYWSWHVWVTDDVAVNGSTYRQGYETDKNNVPFDQVTNRDGSLYKFQWMNRNMGATNAEFLGNDWNKSSGLMYQWGRKDPLPPLAYKDGTGYEINGAAGTFRSKNFTQNTTAPYGWTMRPFDNPSNHTDVSQNIGYAVKNPLRLITFLPRFGHWFSDQSYKVPSSDIYSVVNWDLWSDNRKGLWSNFSTSNAAGAADSKSYELKSAFDPCPCGWRIPSHYGSIVGAGNGNKFSPWGRKANGDDDANDNSKFYLNTANPVLGNTKVYPSLGFDFRQQADRNIGQFPITGAYVFTGPNEVADYVTSTPKVAYINWLSTTGFPTATLSVYDNASGRVFGFVSDYYKFPNQAKYRISVNQISQAKGAATVRCMLDPNEKLLGNFETEYFGYNPNANLLTPDYKSWAKDPNSYIVMTNTTTEQRINLRKAYAMYKLYLSDDFQMPAGQPSVSVYWTTNPSLISNTALNITTEESSEMIVSLNAGQTGNAVVALHMGSTGTAADPVIWSWHIWAPESTPSALAAYKTEEAYQPNPAGQIVNPTNSLVTPPLETQFMDRNLGALVALPSSTTVDPVTGKKAMGLQYQWGRKDPIPTFLDQATILKNGTAINATQYNSSYTQPLSVYAAGIETSTDKRYVKIRKVLKYAVENPLTYLYNDGTTPAKDWISSEAGLNSERWGHATEKSPFDPCPEGWRIPDVSFTFNQPYTQVSTGVKGTSPWYLGKILDPKRTDGVMGIDQIWDSGTDPVILNAASQSYKGKLATYTDGSGTAGWVFNDPIYTIGNYPTTGIRGETSVAVDANFPRTGVWTASMDDGMAGNALGLSIRYSKMATGRGSAPHQAMSCRCAKIQYDANGKEIGRYDPNAIPVTSSLMGRATSEFDKKEIEQILKTDQFVIFPNPVKDLLHIDARDNQDYYYQIYNITGQIMQSGKFADRQTSVSALPAGTYLIRINNAESVVKFIKL